MRYKREAEKSSATGSIKAKDIMAGDITAGSVEADKITADVQFYVGLLMTLCHFDVLFYGHSDQCYALYFDQDDILASGVVVHVRPDHSYVLQDLWRPIK
jgi:hypothetical protein